MNYGAASALNQGTACAEQIIRITGNQFPEVDWELANLFVTPVPGVTVVEMAGIPARTGGVLIAGTDGSEDRQRPDYGTVLGTGPDIDPHQCKPGDHVIVDHEHGKRMTGFIAGAYEAREEVRAYGRMVQSSGACFIIPWQRSILGKLITLPESETAKQMVIRPSGKWILLQRDSLYEHSAGNVIIPDTDLRGAKSRPSKATVVAVGPEVGVYIGRYGPVRYMRIVRGDRLLYMASVVKKFSCPGVEDRNLVMIREDAILSFIEGEVSPGDIDALPLPDRARHPFDDLE